MKIKVKDVRPNPYRNIEHYPLNKEKIIALTKSIEKTGFWDNLVGRKVNGEIQIAYGHHRIEALRLAEGFGYDFEFDLPIKEIDNGTMIQIMANENMQEWSHSIVVIDETVKVAKEYLGLISGKQPSSKQNHKDYISSNDISDFLGWSNSKVSQSLKRLNLIESGTIEKQAVESLPSGSHAEEFATAISVSNVEFTPEEQNKIAKEITDSGVGKRKVKGIIEAKAFEKKYPNAGKSKENKRDSRVITFEHNLLHISNDISNLSDKFLKLKSLHEEIKNISTRKGIDNLEIFFTSIGSLQTRINSFLDVMSKDEELTEENINTLKQLR